MNLRKSIEERLWEYIDGTSSVTENHIIEKFLKDDEEWKHLYEELLEIGQKIKFSEPEKPSLRFTQNIMDKISASHSLPSENKYINKKIIWAISVFIITLISAFLVYGFAQVDWTSAKNNFAFDFAKVDVLRFFTSTNVYIVMTVTVVLGLMLLDRFLAFRKIHYSNR
jgi:hypothetical protein